MNEVRIENFTWLASKDIWPNEDIRTVEENLAKLLNEGWQIEGCGGQGLNMGFVILVRER